MREELVEEIHSWFLETNGSASLMSDWFNIPKLVAENLIYNWETENVNSNPQNEYS